jgi:hypothetical protein
VRDAQSSERAEAGGDHETQGRANERRLELTFTPCVQNDTGRLLVPGHVQWAESAASTARHFVPRWRNRALDGNACDVRGPLLKPTLLCWTDDLVSSVHWRPIVLVGCSLMLKKEVRGGQ